MKLKNIIITVMAVVMMAAAPAVNINVASAAADFMSPLIFGNDGYTSTIVEMPFFVRTSFYDTETSAHFYTQSENEKRYVITYSQYRYESIAYYIIANQ